ncbi:hypothetical protein B0J17DRAFT_683876 [Rhizoctonia solani]|nr:hypothetical protein B0J17DRAFT_683876 [Rhizoctonia solani]
MSEKSCSLDERAEQLKSRGCKILSKVTYEDGQKANDNGANPLGFYIDDGAYRIVQMTKWGDVQDAITTGISKPNEPPVNVALGSYKNVQNTRQVVWQLKRQYGVTNGFTIVPEDITMGEKHDLGPTTVAEGDNIAVKRSECYPIWRIEGVGLLQNDGKDYDAIRYFKIFKHGTNKCWWADRNDNIGIHEAAKGPAEFAEYFELYSIGATDVATLGSLHTDSVVAKDATPVKKVYMATPEATQTYLLRDISIQCQTLSRDQGWATNPERGQWSWFELAIFKGRPKDGQLVKPSDIKQFEGKPLTWTSHENCLSKEPKWLDGAKFTWDHPMHRHLEVGDSIALLMCVQYPRWENQVSSGKLLVERIHMTRILSAGNE